LNETLIEGHSIISHSHSFSIIALFKMAVSPSRRALLTQLEQEGRVMTSSMRAKQKAAQKAAQKLEDEADKVIASLQASQIASNRYKGISTAQPEERIVPEATTCLSANQKRDELAVAAAKVLDELLRG
jgi:hypothetical protein